MASLPRRIPSAKTMRGGRRFSCNLSKSTVIRPCEKSVDSETAATSIGCFCRESTPFCRSRSPCKDHSHRASRSLYGSRRRTCGSPGVVTTGGGGCTRRREKRSTASGDTLGSRAGGCRRRSQGVYSTSSGGRTRSRATQRPSLPRRDRRGCPVVVQRRCLTASTKSLKAGEDALLG
ncbi:hypothetical protein GGI64_002962 [Rhizobium leguminosarum]|uniref:Uncharacterized protein n=1 Tax=Rhizobium leguminosarum TaxID=384 RepID=A0A7Z0DYW3_RHILE|nr:hypothetical protein [Rhizobium leguminosarum]